MSCFVIAEAGVNHNGSEAVAMQLIDVAAAAGADAVKFQTFRAETLVLPGAEKADYQRQQTGAGDQFSMLKALELTEAIYARLLERCHERKIQFMSTPFDREAVDFLVGLGMSRIKVPSGELTNLPFLAYLAEKNLPLIVSTGMATLEEVGEAVTVIRSVRKEQDYMAPLEEMLTLLHCTSSYPTALEDVNLMAIQTLRDTFGLPVGYSDHTPGILISVAAVAMGATVIEKHFTLDRNLPGPDHKASLEPDKLTRMIADIRVVERSLGTGEKAPRPGELAVRDLVRRSVTLIRSLKAGELIHEQDLVLLRPGVGIAPREMHQIIGKRVKADQPAGKTLTWSDIFA